MGGALSAGHHCCCAQTFDVRILGGVFDELVDLPTVARFLHADARRASCWDCRENVNMASRLKPGALAAIFPHRTAGYSAARGLCRYRHVSQSCWCCWASAFRRAFCRLAGLGAGVVLGLSWACAGLRYPFISLFSEETRGNRSQLERHSRLARRGLAHDAVKKFDGWARYEPCVHGPFPTRGIAPLHHPSSPAVRPPGLKAAIAATNPTFFSCCFPFLFPLLQTL